MRGVNLHVYAGIDQLKAAIDQGAKLFRYQVMPETDLAKSLGKNLPEYSRFMRENYWPKIDSFIPHLGDCKLLIDMHQPVGGGDAFYGSTELIGAWVWTWQETAKRYKGVKEVVGYGLLNEPSGRSGKVSELMRVGVNTIRQIDTEKVIAVTCRHSKPDNFSDTPHFADPNIWYEVHYYEPMRFTHMGLKNHTGTGTSRANYPTASFGPVAMARAMKPMIKFRERHPNAQIFVGEFSVNQNVKTADRVRYIRDLVALMNRYNFHWAYHIVGEPNSVWEAGPDVLEELKKGWS